MDAGILELLKSRGVLLHEIAEIVYQLQSPYSPDLIMEECIQAVLGVLKKREVQYAILTGIALDRLAEEKKLPGDLQDIVENDEPLYGMDEVLAAGICNMYGTIGITSFGYLDKAKVGIVGKLNQKSSQINTFLDDLVAAVAAAASARIAHKYGTRVRKPVL